jgi:carboxyl-terminal processing protease
MTFALVAQQTIFDYATQFVIGHSDIPEPGQFTITDAFYSDFKNYVTALEGFKYQSESMEQFEKLEEAAKEEGYFDTASEVFNQLKKTLELDVARDLDNFRDEVEVLLGTELVKRYYFQAGAIQFNLQDDEVLKMAQETINDEQKYQGLLNGTVLSHAGDKRKR